ncbi:acyltransferase family protein [Phormidesmis sp. 146-12]
MQWKILAGVRFFLAWIVLCNHLRWFLPADNILLNFSELDAFTAVLGFLLLSGYSIAHSLMKGSKGFYKRRIFRVYPLYILSIFVSLVPFALLGSPIQSPTAEVFIRPLWREVVANFFFLQGYLSAPLSSNAILWTLSIEVLCYLVAPFLLKLKSKYLLGLIGISAISYAAYPRLGLPYYSHLMYGVGFLILLWVWLLGFIYAREVKHRELLGHLILVLGTVLIGVNDLHPLAPLTYGLTVLALIYAESIKLPLAFANAVEYLGELSYPLFLFHLPTLIIATSFLKIYNSVALVGLTFAVSMLFYHVVDVPLRRKPAKPVPSSSH